jgi:hypothetical protein
MASLECGLPHLSHAAGAGLLCWIGEERQPNLVRAGASEHQEAAAHVAALHEARAQRGHALPWLEARDLEGDRLGRPSRAPGQDCRQQRQAEAGMDA